MADFTVDRSQLTAAAGTFQQLHQQASGTRTSLAGVPLSQDDFGRVPWLETRVWEAYDEHHQACVDSLAELVGALQDVHDGLVATAAAYRQMDEDSETAVEFIIKHLDAGPKPK